MRAWPGRLQRRFCWPAASGLQGAKSAGIAPADQAMVASSRFFLHVEPWIQLDPRTDCSGLTLLLPRPRRGIYPPSAGARVVKRPKLPLERECCNGYSGPLRSKCRPATKIGIPQPIDGKPRGPDWPTLLEPARCMARSCCGATPQGHECHMQVYLPKVCCMYAHTSYCMYIFVHTYMAAPIQGIFLGPGERREEHRFPRLFVAVTPTVT